MTCVDLDPSVVICPNVDAYYQLMLMDHWGYCFPDQSRPSHPIHPIPQKCNELWYEFDANQRFDSFKNSGRRHWWQRFVLRLFDEQVICEALKECFHDFNDNQHKNLNRTFQNSSLDDCSFDRLCEHLSVDTSQSLPETMVKPAEAWSCIRVGQVKPTFRWRDGKRIVGSRLCEAPLKVVLPALVTTLSAYAFADDTLDQFMQFWDDVKKTKGLRISEQLVHRVKDGCLRWLSVLQVKTPSYHMDQRLFTYSDSEMACWIAKSWSLYGRAGVALRELLIEADEDSSSSPVPINAQSLGRNVRSGVALHELIKDADEQPPLASER